MKAIEQFKMEAVEQFGAGSVISEESAKQILKTIGRSGFGLGHLKQSGMSLKSGEYQLPVDFQESKVAKISKPKPKKVSKVAAPVVETVVELLDSVQQLVVIEVIFEILVQILIVPVLVPSTIYAP